MRKTILIFIVCVLSALAVQAQTTDANTTALKNALQAKLEEWHKAGSFPGATFGVALPNGESFGLAVGYSDRDAKTPLKPNDRMLAGSVGKTFAAATALQLVKEGKIGLDDKIEKYLGREPWFTRLPNAKDITVRQLMNHTSGLVRYEFKEQFTKDLTANPEKVWKPAELLSYLFDAKAPFEAGKGWDYSDTNYIVLGMIIEKVTGRKFYDEANRRLIKPLKLTDTIPQDGPRLKGVVQGYAGPNNPFGGTDAMIVNGKFAINPQFEWTGGGYVSTAHDLARWARMFYEGKAFSADLLPQVVDGVAAPMLGRETKYGLCAIIRKTTAGTSYGHSGFFPGYMTDMMYFPEQKIAVAVQVNTSVGRNLGKPLSRVLVEMMEVITAKRLHHFVFFGMEREKLRETKSFLDTKAFEGAQVSYTWRQLEPRKDEYDFSLIREDLEFLSQHGKKLWIQLQDVSFSERRIPVPKYLIEEPQYHGGANLQYEFKNDDEAQATPAGWAARRWDPAVQERFHKLLFALAKEFDGRIEGINFAESSIVFGLSHRPDGFTPQKYSDALVTNLKVLKSAFSKSIALQYANFMPGEWRPSEDKGYLRAVYNAAHEMKAGVGGPDLLPYKPGQMGSSYELIREVGGDVKVGIAVQDGNYDHVNPKTGKRVTIAELIAFATEYLKADYIFWCTEEPYYSNELVAFMRAAH
jgi:D-alanyl-D-alanine carboxypeptidase